MIMEGTLYFAMKLTVRSNALHDSFKSGVFTKDGLKTRCTRFNGSGITFEFKLKLEVLPNVSSSVISLKIHRSLK